MRYVSMFVAAGLTLAAPAQAALIGTLSYVTPTGNVASFRPFNGPIRSNQLVDINLRLTLDANSDPLIINGGGSVSAASFPNYTGSIDLNNPNTFIGLGTGVACTNSVFCNNGPFPQNIFTFAENGGTAALGNSALTIAPGGSYEWLAGSYIPPASNQQLVSDLVGTFALPNRSLTITATNGAAQETLASFSTCAVGTTCASRTFILSGNGSSATSPLLPSSVNNTTGGSNFLVSVNSGGQRIFIDPLVASGYDYAVTSGPNITSALFPTLGDSNGYEVYALSGGVIGALLGTVPDGGLFTFASGGVSAFALRDIDTALGLSPTNQVAFITGLTFNVTGATNISLTQTPVTTFVNPLTNGGAVPEPATWLSMMAGFALLGGSIRRQKQTTRVRFAL